MARAIDELTPDELDAREQDEAVIEGLTRARSAVHAAAKSSGMPLTWLVVVVQAIDAELAQARGE